MTSCTKLVKVAVADDHSVVREGFRIIMARQPDMEVVGEAKDGDESIDLCQTARPDVIFMDVDMPGMNGMEATRAISKRWPEIKIIGISKSFGTVAQTMLRLGASGFLHKNCDVEEFVHAARAALSGERYIRRGTARAAPDTREEWNSSIERDEEDELSAQERELLMLIANGMTPDEAGRQLNISPESAAAHEARIMAKTDSSSPADLIKYALKTGLLNPL